MRRATSGSRGRFAAMKPTNAPSAERLPMLRMVKTNEVYHSKALEGKPTIIRIVERDKEDDWLWIIEYVEFEGKSTGGSTIGMSEEFILENFKKPL